MTRERRLRKVEGLLVIDPFDSTASRSIHSCNFQPDFEFAKVVVQQEENNNLCPESRPGMDKLRHRGQMLNAKLI